MSEELRDGVVNIFTANDKRIVVIRSGDEIIIGFAGNLEKTDILQARIDEIQKIRRFMINRACNDAPRQREFMIVYELMEERTVELQTLIKKRKEE